MKEDGQALLEMRAPGLGTKPKQKPSGALATHGLGNAFVMKSSDNILFPNGDFQTGFNRKGLLSEENTECQKYPFLLLSLSVLQDTREEASGAEIQFPLYLLRLVLVGLLCGHG